MDYTKIGQYLSELRKYYKITQDELANHLSVSRQSVSRWETGASIPGIEILLKLSDLYGITINEILEADSGFAVNVSKVFMKPDTYPRFWK